MLCGHQRRLWRRCLCHQHLARAFLSLQSRVVRKKSLCADEDTKDIANRAMRLHSSTARLESDGLWRDGIWGVYDLRGKRHASISTTPSSPSKHLHPVLISSVQSVNNLAWFSVFKNWDKPDHNGAFTCTCCFSPDSGSSWSAIEPRLFIYSTVNLSFRSHHPHFLQFKNLCCYENRSAAR